MVWGSTASQLFVFFGLHTCFADKVPVQGRTHVSFSGRERTEFGAKVDGWLNSLASRSVSRSSRCFA